MNQENIRVVALYRASTKSQTDKENNNDIPTQRKIVQNFIFSKGWNIVREFTEGGISGYKIHTKDRDALNDIKQMAENNEFDILVVYMSDRIGRIADETPLVISHLNQHNVKIFSCSEGEISSHSHNDKLMTYLRFWQNEGESIKTSKRVSDYLIEAVEEGRFKGGNCIPLGYMLVDNGTKNFKGRFIKDFVINPEEVELVKLIYHLSSKLNYGQRRIAIYLNEHGYKTRGNQPWKADRHPLFGEFDRLLYIP
jgi:site-specific DNA recombinase